MPGRLRTAIVASSDASVWAVLPRMLASAAVELLFFAENFHDAMHALTDLRPDLLVCDSQLVGCEGVFFAESILRKGGLPVRPRVLLMHYPEFRSSGMEKISGMGAQCIEKPVRWEALHTAIERLRSTKAVFLPKEIAAAERTLDLLGIPRHRGRECLKIASLLCAHDERYLQRRNRRLYPDIGRLMGIQAALVESEIRTAIEAAAGSGSFENQYRIFADTVDAERGQPTSGEMIARLADILRMEG